MAGIGSSFIGGVQAGQRQRTGALKQTMLLEDIKTQRAQTAKSERIQGYLGQYGKAPAGERPGIEQQLLGEDPELAAKLREFRTEGEAKTADELAGLAAVARQAVGTPEEGDAMLWLGQQAEALGVPRETIQSALTQYQQNPGSAPMILDNMMVRGMGAKDFLSEAGSRETRRLAALKVPARQQKIESTMEDYGVSAKEARDIVDGRLKVSVDTETGQTMITNIATQETRPATLTGVKPPAGVPEPTPTPEEVAEVPEETVFDLIGKGVGAVAVGKEAISRTVGQAFPELTFPETTKARTKTNALRNKLVVALAISGRPPGFEQENILAMLPSKGIWESAPRAITQLTELHGILSRQVLDDMAFYSDRANPKKIRIEARDRARGITAVLRELGTPPPSEEGAEEQISTQEEYNDLLSGALYIDTETGQRGRKP